MTEGRGDVRRAEQRDEGGARPEGGREAPAPQGRVGRCPELRPGRDIRSGSPVGRPPNPFCRH